MIIVIVSNACLSSHDTVYSQCTSFLFVNCASIKLEEGIENTTKICNNRKVSLVFPK